MCVGVGECDEDVVNVWFGEWVKKGCGVDKVWEVGQMKVWYMQFVRRG